MPLIDRKSQRARLEVVKGLLALGMQSDEVIEEMKKKFNVNRSTVYNYIKKAKEK